jgi:hypothetical protein
MKISKLSITLLAVTTAFSMLTTSLFAGGHSLAKVPREQTLGTGMEHHFANWSD